MHAISMCVGCIIAKQEKSIRKFSDEDKKLEYMQQVLKIVLENSSQESAPGLTELLNRVYQEFWGEGEDFGPAKHQYNQLLLEKEPELDTRIRETKDPVRECIKYVCAANYIDFSAVDNVNEDTFETLLEKAAGETVPAEEYARFCEDLRVGKSLVYLTDNCGEIVLDKVLIKTIRKLYPQIDITVITRGGDALNDATVEDALAVGMDKIARVIGNGLAVPGTELKKISAESLSCINNADVIISKGMGNFETVSSCGLNVYYIFLCKCSYFERRFKLPRLTGVFIRELDHTPEYWNTF